MGAFFARVLSYWRIAAAFIGSVLVPYVVGQVRDRVLGDWFDFAWRKFNFPDVVATIWMWLESNPLLAATYATLVSVGVSALRAQHSIRQEQPNRAFWLECEQGFALISGEVCAISQENAEGRVRWSVHPMGVRGGTGDPRDVDRFMAEARRSGAALASMPSIPRRFRRPGTTDLGDEWLNVVTALVRFPRASTGDGHNSADLEFGRYTTIGFDDLVRASRDACRQLASGHPHSVLAEPVRATSPDRPHAPDVEFTNYIDLHADALKLGGIEHISDESIPITSFPSLLDAVTFPTGAPPGRSINLAPGQSLDLRFRDPLVGFGFYYQQGLYPGNFNIYYKDGTQRAIVGRNYPPHIEFVGEASERLIDRIVIQTQLAGNVSIKTAYFFPRNKHERILR